MGDLRYFLFDTETTGPTPADKVVEVAWIEFDKDLKILNEVCQRLDPEMPISPGASGVHHITDDMLVNEPTIEEFFMSEGYHPEPEPGPIKGDICFIAYNSVFDLRYLKPWINDVVVDLCMLRAARKFIPDAPDHKLQTIRYYLGLTTEGNAHAALGDVKTTLSLMKYLFETPGIPVNNIDELLASVSKPTLLKNLYFGKHKGPFKDVPKGYLNWMKYKSKMDMDADLTYTVDYYLGLQT